MMQNFVSLERHGSTGFNSHCATSGAGFNRVEGLDTKYTIIYPEDDGARRTFGNIC